MRVDTIAVLVEHRASWEEAEVKRMLGAWVSELEPELLFHAGHLIGLTHAGIIAGERAPVLVRARAYPSPILQSSF